MALTLKILYSFFKFILGGGLHNILFFGYTSSDLYGGGDLRIQNRLKKIFATEVSDTINHLYIDDFQVILKHAQVNQYISQKNLKLSVN